MVFSADTPLSNEFGGIKGSRNWDSEILPYNSVTAREVRGMDFFQAPRKRKSGSNRKARTKKAHAAAVPPFLAHNLSGGAFPARQNNRVPGSPSGYFYCYHV
jgi:hypothetical protein